MDLQRAVNKTGRSTVNTRLMSNYARFLEIIGHDGLAPYPVHFLARWERNDIAATSRYNRHDDTDGPARVISCCF